MVIGHRPYTAGHIDGAHGIFQQLGFQKTVHGYTTGQVKPAAWLCWSNTLRLGGLLGLYATQAAQAQNTAGQ